MESEKTWTWVYFGIFGGGDLMVEIPEEIALGIFDGKPLPASIPSRRFTTVKVRKETEAEFEARVRKHKIQAPILETVIETHAWVVEKEKAVDGTGPLFAHAILWARRPCEELTIAANALWKESSIIVPRNGILPALR